MSSDPVVLVTVCAFHNAPEVARFACEVLEGDRPAVQLAVCDNGSDPEVSTMLPREVLVVRGEENRGYLSGCAAALEAWTEETGDLPDWVVVSNTDVRLAPDFFSKFQALWLEDDTGIVAPSVIRTEDGKNQNPFLRRRPSRMSIRLARAVHRSDLLTAAAVRVSRVRSRMRRAARSADRASVPSRPCSIPIYAPHGSIFLVRRAFFDRGGELALGSLLYGEEIHIGEQARCAGLRVIWRPDLVAYHEEAQTTGKVSVRQRRQWLEMSSELLWTRYFRDPEQADLRSVRSEAVPVCDMIEEDEQ